MQVPRFQTYDTDQWPNADSAGKRTALLPIMDQLQQAVLQEIPAGEPTSAILLWSGRLYQ